ncbi:hypothetical protein I553_1750 [Mycobacterium xenopi 4042]|uniref:Uncharacterized protein n=1 Tax=Mycobacterium xenopi 4042 TaxID=1299334 RepID=X8DIT9_MYCXE|nr:hypothetical protein I553_1750 [Mycobacterium xenopi 4042]
MSAAVMSSTRWPTTACSAADARRGSSRAPAAHTAAAHPVVAVELDRHGGACDRKVAVPARELLDGKPASPAPYGKPYGR